MSLENFSWHDNSKRFAKDSHAIFGASSYHWLNYDEQKMIDTYVNAQMKKKGTELHALAASLIENKIALKNIDKTFNMYVNDAILYDLRPEQQLYFSEFFYGTADAIRVSDGVLRIHDLKTGRTKPSIKQLEIYAAFFCLEYDILPSDFDEIILCLYYDNDVISENPDDEIIFKIMDKIITIDGVLQKISKEVQQNV